VVRVRGVDSPAVVVGDLARSQAFYCDLLGLRVVDVKGAGSTWTEAERARFDAYHARCVGFGRAEIAVALLQAPDGTHLELIEYRWPRLAPAARSPAEPGGVVVQFAVEGSDAIAERLRAAGATILGGPEPYELDGVRSLTTYVADPDGTMVCLFEVDPARTGSAP
jgi:catechol 2,3-dioxygenase-like lactoylglutathione lyase family enzyme